MPSVCGRKQRGIAGMTDIILRLLLNVAGCAQLRQVEFCVRLQRPECKLFLTARMGLPLGRARRHIFGQIKLMQAEPYILKIYQIAAL